VHGQILRLAAKPLKEGLVYCDQTVHIVRES
jgi:hypothetical protein